MNKQKVKSDFVSRAGDDITPGSLCRYDDFSKTVVFCRGDISKNLGMGKIYVAAQAIDTGAPVDVGVDGYVRRFR